jgi:hypothetical protein
MVITSVGGTAITTAIADIIDTGAYGTGSSTPATTDTTLDAEVGSSVKSLNVSTSGQTINIIHELTFAEGNGETYNEFGVYDTDGVLLFRVVTTPIDKDNTFELITTANLEITTD